MFLPPPHSVPAGAADPLAPPAANETFPTLRVSRFHREALVPLQSNEPWPLPRRGSLQSPATLASSTKRHTGPRFVPSPFPLPSSHWRAARQSKPAPHTGSPRRAAAQRRFHNFRPFANLFRVPQTPVLLLQQDQPQQGLRLRLLREQIAQNTP